MSKRRKKRKQKNPVIRPDAITEQTMIDLTVPIVDITDIQTGDVFDIKPPSSDNEICPEEGEISPDKGSGSGDEEHTRPMDTGLIFELNRLEMEELFLEDAEDLEERIYEESESLFDTKDIPQPTKKPREPWDAVFERLDAAKTEPWNRFQTKEFPKLILSEPIQSNPDKKPDCQQIRLTPKPCMPDFYEQTKLTMDLPLMIRGHGSVIYITIGSRSLRLNGIRSGRNFIINSADLRYWGTSGGPAITATEREQLMWILSVKSQPSPWMRLIFYEGGTRIRYENNGERKQKRRCGSHLFDCLYHDIDHGNHADRRNSIGV